MKKNKKIKVNKLSNDELELLLEKSEWCDRELLKEYDNRRHNGRIKFTPVPLDNLQKHLRKKYSMLRKKKAC